MRNEKFVICNPPRESEFGSFLATGFGGNIVKGDDGSIRFISMAFNPLTSDQLLEIAEFMETL